MRISNEDVVISCAVRDHLIQNPTLRISITDLAKQFHISRSKLIFVYKALFNKSIKQHQLRLMMDYALSELESGAQVKELSYRLGYSSPKNFARAFKQVHAYLPKAVKSGIGADLGENLGETDD
jgi:two-component system, response regulator YesN